MQTLDTLSFADACRALEVPPGATEPEIKASYRRLAMRYHPDRNPGDPALSLPRFLRVKRAYEVLRDSGRRRAEEREHRASSVGRSIRPRPRRPRPFWFSLLDDLLGGREVKALRAWERCARRPPEPSIL
ncbi:MAG: J domain-containing protein, partial [Planctomycetota bacterium]